ncbi:MAG: DciA family protein [Litorimonas sp.]
MSDDDRQDPATRRVILSRYLEAQRGRPQARPLPSAGMAVNRVMRPLSKKSGTRGGSARALQPIWGEIMGPRWSKISTPVRFRARSGERTLVISAPGAAASLILAASGPILERLNAHLGQGHVQGLQVVQAAPATSRADPPKRGLRPSEEAALRDGLAEVRGGRLKDALERLGREVLRNQP